MPYNESPIMPSRLSDAHVFSAAGLSLQLLRRDRILAATGSADLRRTHVGLHGAHIDNRTCVHCSQAVAAPV